MRWMCCGLGLIVAITVAPAHADAPPASSSPWLDEHPVPALAPSAPHEERDTRSWRFLAATMLGIRGDQGGQLDAGYRFVGILGLITPPLSFSLALDKQVGDDNHIPGMAGDPATFSEWVGSARVGYSLPIGPDFWLQVAGGVARVNTRVTRMATGHEGEIASFGMDAVATVVWRSGLIASTLVFGATVVPSDRDIVVDDVTYVAPARVEPWFGLGVALMF